MYCQNFPFSLKIKKIDLSNGKNCLNRKKKQKSKYHIEIHKEDSIYLMSNYHYFSSFLSHLTPTVSGEIFAWKHWLPWSKMFYPTLGGRSLNMNIVKTQPWLNLNSAQCNSMQLGLRLDTVVTWNPPELHRIIRLFGIRK